MHPLNDLRNKTTETSIWFWILELLIGMINHFTQTEPRDQTVFATGWDIIRIPTGIFKRFKFENALLCSKMGRKVMSVNDLQSRGINIYFSSNNEKSTRTS